MKKYSLIAIVIIVIISLFACQSFDESNIDRSSQITLFAFNTIIELTINDHYSETLDNEVNELIKELESKYSRYLTDSEVSRLNLNAGQGIQKVSKEMLEILTVSKKYHELSNGTFDITIGPIVDLWSIGSLGEQVPEDMEINQALKQIGFDRVLIESNTISLESDFSLDFGGILKGYAADQIVQLFKKYKVEDGIINLGGNIYVLGNSNDKKWRVAVRDPFKGQSDYVGILSLTNKSVVTSGPYEKNFIHAGIRYHHIFNALTGYPVENEIESVTIVSDLSVDGDALTTTIFAMGLTDGLVLLESMVDVDAIIITKDKKVYITNELLSSFELIDESFEIIN